jgi:hypothetical protein
MRFYRCHSAKRLRAVLFCLMTNASLVLAGSPDDNPWARVTENDRAIKIETDNLEAVIPKQNPKHWMTGIEKGSFLDKTTGFREIGDGLMEPGSDETWNKELFAADGNGLGRYSWHNPIASLVPAP